jgi:dethiobiotin synthetase
MSAVFIAGSHTDVGKTHMACALLRGARAAGLTVDACKPVVSGYDPAAPQDSDPWRLLEAMGREPTPAAVEALSPWRYRAPLAPPMAARLEGERLELGAMAELCRARLAASEADLFVVEGVGGLMSPLAEGATGLDLMTALELPVLLVGGTYLGGISHTLTALEVLRARGLEVAALVLSQAGDPDAPDFEASVAMTADFTGPTPLLAAPRGGPAPDAALVAILGLPQKLG